MSKLKRDGNTLCKYCERMLSYVEKHTFSSFSVSCWCNVWLQKLKLLSYSLSYSDMLSNTNSEKSKEEFIFQLLSDWKHIYMVGMGLWHRKWKCQKELNSEKILFSGIDLQCPTHPNVCVNWFLRFSQSNDIYTWLEWDRDTENENVKRN